MHASLVFLPDKVRFQLRVKTDLSNTDANNLHHAISVDVATASEEVTAPEQAFAPEPLCFLYADDQGGARLQALKLAVSLGVKVDKPKWDKEEMRGERPVAPDVRPLVLTPSAGSRTRSEGFLRITGETPSEVAPEVFLATADEWASKPCIFVLDQVHSALLEIVLSRVWRLTSTEPGLRAHMHPR